VGGAIITGQPVYKHLARSKVKDWKAPAAPGEQAKGAAPRAWRRGDSAFPTRAGLPRARRSRVGASEGLLSTSGEALEPCGCRLRTQLGAAYTRRS